MKLHLDACSGNRANRHREEAVRRKKAKEAEVKRRKGTEWSGSSADIFSHPKQRRITDAKESSDDELFGNGQEEPSQRQASRQTSEDDELGESLETLYQEAVERRPTRWNLAVDGQKKML